MKNSCYLCWNWRVRRSFHNKYLTMDWSSGNSVHQSFTRFQWLNWCNSTFCHSRVPTSLQNSEQLTNCASTHEPAASYCGVSKTDCSYGFLWTHDVEVIVLRDCDNLWSCELFSRWCQTFWINLFVYFTNHFWSSVFQHGALIAGP